ncbi:outer membrane protein assembly factor BamD [Wolbachia endosymbiont of Howardula sp.]|uniref:outer membrane protein assembly factor BamD n=1 Tax=Wolbachia endosymbiont of Howardula sp. TaxID=2916816 RepID=UPI00217DB2E2|nr:outer membrane protein assembly factor BamD [Wolbachia endosymbiont of Howardula sp.]UWI83287.1 outer membrane protein assembly factor BamD [Wolbachia endosymbiont of Howardula sp.]
MYKTIIVYCIISLLFSYTNLYGNIYTNFNKTENELYQSGYSLFVNKKYLQVIQLYQNMESIYPGTYYTLQIQLLSSISSYKTGQYAHAISNIENYIYKCNIRNNINIPYVYYLRILFYYMHIHNIKFGQETAYKTLEFARTYIELFLDSKYLNEVQQIEKRVINHIAYSEYSIGKFYLQHGKYLSSIICFQNILKKYKNSDYYSKVIKNLIIAYSALGLYQEAYYCQNDILY